MRVSALQVAAKLGLQDASVYALCLEAHRMTMRSGRRSSQKRIQTCGSGAGPGDGLCGRCDVVVRAVLVFDQKEGKSRRAAEGRGSAACSVQCAGDGGVVWCTRRALARKIL